jgi:hypothetical protein
MVTLHGCALRVTPGATPAGGWQPSKSLSDDRKKPPVTVGNSTLSVGASRRSRVTGPAQRYAFGGENRSAGLGQIGDGIDSAVALPGAAIVRSAPVSGIRQTLSVPHRNPVILPPPVSPELLKRESGRRSGVRTTARAATATGSTCEEETQWRHPATRSS